MEVRRIYDSVVRENGILACLGTSIAADVVPFATKPTGLQAFNDTIGKLQSGEFRDQIMEQAEPPLENLTQFEKQCRDIVPSLAHHFTAVGKKGPQYRHGGRRTKLADPKVRVAICHEIKRRRGPGVTLQVLFESIGQSYDVSASKIKQIWLECPTEDLDKP